MTFSEAKYTVDYSEDMVRDAVRHYVWKNVVTHQKGLWIAEFALLAFLVVSISTGDTSFITGALSTIILIPPLFIFLVWKAHYRNTVGKFRSMATPTAEVTFRDDGMAIASELGSGHLPWSTITEIWERPSYWMIFTGPNQFNTLPIRSISQADREMLRSKISHCA